MWVKLGTATNFCIAPNNRIAWNSIAGAKAYSSTDGLNTSTYTLITHVFMAPTTVGMNMHIGANAQSNPAVLLQTAGTVFAYGFQLKLRDITSVLDGALSTLGNISSPNITTMETNISFKVEPIRYIYKD